MENIKKAISLATELTFEQYARGLTRKQVHTRRVFIYHAFKSGVSIPELAEMFGQTRQSIKKQIDNYRDDILWIRDLRIINNYFEYFIKQIENEIKENI